MIRIRIPNDNSCLFTAIDYLIHGEHRQFAANELRQVCTTEILSNPRIYDELYLSKNPIDYCSWLLLDTSWGGEIEIAILSKLYNVIICVIPLNTLRPLRYDNTATPTITTTTSSSTTIPSSPLPSTPPQGIIFLLYTGQHYDAIIRQNDFQKLFNFNSEEDIQRLEALAIECCRIEKDNWEKELRTRIRKKIKCCGCGTIVENGNEFQIHCETVEHDEEFCYDCEEIEVTEMVENSNDE